MKAKAKAIVPREPPNHETSTATKAGRMSDLRVGACHGEG